MLRRILPQFARLGIENRPRTPLLLLFSAIFMMIFHMANSATTPQGAPRNPAASPPPVNAIPPRERYRPARNPSIPPQPTARTHTIRLAIATGIGLVLMFALLMLAVKYAQLDWNRKNHRAAAARVHPAAATTETPAAAAPAGWKFVPSANATRRQLEQLAAAPRGLNGWLILARGLSGKNDPELVVASLRMAMAIAGESAEIRNDIGAAYLQQKRMKEASAQFHAADQIRPGSPPALYNLALCAISDRNPARAIRRLGQYLGQRPDDATALRLQATLLAQVGRTDEALNMLEKFLKNQPADQPLFLEAAQLAARLNQPGKALRYLETSFNGNSIQAVIRTYQSGVFRDIRLSGEGDALAARLAEKARLAYSSPIPDDEIRPLLETAPEAIVR